MTDTGESDGWGDIYEFTDPGLCRKLVLPVERATVDTASYNHHASGKEAPLGTSCRPLTLSTSFRDTLTRLDSGNHDALNLVLDVPFATDIRNQAQVWTCHLEEYPDIVLVVKLYRIPPDPSDTDYVERPPWRVEAKTYWKLSALQGSLIPYSLGVFGVSSVHSSLTMMC